MNYLDRQELAFVKVRDLGFADEAWTRRRRRPARAPKIRRARWRWG
ncbi:MAG: hypothetical protein WKF73_13970 [Nocardioidaceae bacterium]